MSTTMKEAVHLGLKYSDKLVPYRNTNFEEHMTLLDITQSLILVQDFEILNVSAIEWMRSILLSDKVIRWTKAKIHV